STQAAQQPATTPSQLTQPQQTQPQQSTTKILSGAAGAATGGAAAHVTRHAPGTAQHAQRNVRVSLPPALTSPHIEPMIMPPRRQAAHVRTPVAPAVHMRQTRRIALVPAGAGPAQLPVPSSPDTAQAPASVDVLRRVATAIERDPQAAGGVGALATVVLLGGVAFRSRRLAGLRPFAAVRVV
ncbi:MAG TPA: hypothetical protein VKJ07_01565, partial [Mycobacteriales bacterium]|nr:hypothetical protein [Mycobacteriales bacterium]